MASLVRPGHRRLLGHNEGETETEKSPEILCGRFSSLLKRRLVQKIGTKILTVYALGEKFAEKKELHRGWARSVGEGGSVEWTAGESGDQQLRVFFLGPEQLRGFFLWPEQMRVFFLGTEQLRVFFLGPEQLREFFYSLA